MTDAKNEWTQGNWKVCKRTNTHASGIRYLPTHYVHLILQIARQLIFWRSCASNHVFRSWNSRAHLVANMNFIFCSLTWKWTASNVDYSSSEVTACCWLYFIHFSHVLEFGHTRILILGKTSPFDFNHNWIVATDTTWKTHLYLCVVHTQNPHWIFFVIVETNELSFDLSNVLCVIFIKSHSINEQNSFFAWICLCFAQWSDYWWDQFFFVSKASCLQHLSSIVFIEFNSDQATLCIIGEVRLDCWCDESYGWGVNWLDLCF